MLKGETLLADRYKIVKTLGQGGMGAVYLAEDQRLPTAWAIKEMKRQGLTPEELQEAAELFRTEARLLSDLRHRNLPRIVDFFQESAQLYLVMDFIEGETLEARILRDGPISLDLALNLSLQISDVLDYLHSRPEPIIFRDFKPGNVMLTSQNEVKLVDFGIARIFRKDQNKDTKALGTPGYAAPEQYGKGQSGPQTDLYAFGATMHHALSGHDPTNEPFNFAPLATYRQDLPQAFAALITACLSLQASARPASAFAVKREIEQLLGLSGSTSLTGRAMTMPLGDHRTTEVITPSSSLITAATTTISPTTTPPPAPTSVTAHASETSTTASTPSSGIPAAAPIVTAAEGSSQANSSNIPTGTTTLKVSLSPSVLSFRTLGQGQHATLRLRAKTTQPITLNCDSPQIELTPNEVPPGTSSIKVALNTQGLQEGSHFKATIRCAQAPESSVTVEAMIVPAQASTAVRITAAGLACATLIPFLNYLTTMVLLILTLSLPSPQRPSLRLSWRISAFLTLCWTGAFAVIFFGLSQVNWEALKTYL